MDLYVALKKACEIQHKWVSEDSLSSTNYRGSKHILILNIEPHIYPQGP